MIRRLIYSFFNWLVADLPQPDPVMDALRAERARPLRERRPYCVIDAEMQRITRKRLEAVVPLDMNRLGL